MKILGLVVEMEKTIFKINCRREAATKTIKVLESKLEKAKGLSDNIKGHEGEDFYMTEEGIRQEEITTHERLFQPKKLVEEIEELEGHPDYLDPNHIENLEVEIEMKKYSLRSEENASQSVDNKSSTGKEINFFFGLYGQIIEGTF